MSVVDYKNLGELVKPINWNRLEDPKDREILDVLESNFWLPEEIAMANDKVTWKNLTDAEKLLTSHVFAGLTLLDTVQSQFGAEVLKFDAETQHEAAVFSQITYMEAVHARSYSNIFSTLLSSEDIDEVMTWAWNNPHLRKKQEIILSYYQGDDPFMRKIASVMLESFLFYSGFFWAFYLSSRQTLTNTATMIALILRDESIHGYYIGYKFQRMMERLTQDEREEYRVRAEELFHELYKNEILYTESLYDTVLDTRPGITEEVKKFLRYNGNKAMLNLGLEPLFSREETEILPAILTAMSPNSNDNHDFFSDKGSSYKRGTVEETDDEDWD